MNYSQEDQEISCPYEKVEDILTGNIYKKGEIIQLKDWDLCILKGGSL